jgi:hypothetical protein
VTQEYFGGLIATYWAVLSLGVTGLSSVLALSGFSRWHLSLPGSPSLVSAPAVTPGFHTGQTVQKCSVEISKSTSPPTLSPSNPCVTLPWHPPHTCVKFDLLSQPDLDETPFLLRPLGKSQWPVKPFQLCTSPSAGPRHLPGGTPRDGSLWLSDNPASPSIPLLGFQLLST